MEIEGIHLTKEDGKTVVEVCIAGLWYPVIEAKNGTRFDHYVSSGEISTIDLVKDDKPIVVQDIDYGASCEHVHPGQSCGRSQVYGSKG